MTQEIINTIFWSEEGQFYDVLFSTSDDCIFFNKTDARIHIKDMELDNEEIEEWIPQAPPDEMEGTLIHIPLNNVQ